MITSRVGTVYDVASSNSDTAHGRLVSSTWPTHEMLIAHSKGGAGHSQPLLGHLANVAGHAAVFAAPFKSSAFAEWAGWWHDAGKVAEDVQAYLLSTSSSPPGPDHSSAGMLMACEVFEPLAFSIAGHHGGLPDAQHLRDRIQRKRSEARILSALERAKELLGPHATSLSPPLRPPFLTGNDPNTRRRTEFWIRMLHSALVDADALDAAVHFHPTKESMRSPGLTIAALWQKLEESQEKLIRTSSGTVNRLRASIYRNCINAAASSSGIFTLTVPTGGGKTRSAMAFALKHALMQGKQRVIVALPYTSIIEQNAQTYRSIFGDLSVLEHHSSIDTTESKEGHADLWLRLAAENWDAPIVVTTTVQLFESLFSNQTRQCRKLHNIAQSVLVLDEVQTLPPHLLASTLDVLQHLVDAYGVTLLLCTATQPALVARDGFAGLQGANEIVPNHEEIFSKLRRVSYDLALDEPWSWSRLAQELEPCTQVMIVLNTIKDAMALLDRVDRPDVLHLSTQLCAVHRRRVLQEVKKRLREHKPVCLISTQVVEAGVDIDFPVVFRAIGPLDRIIQAAGRCNREGKEKVGRVVVFDPAEGRQPPGAYKTGTDVTQALIVENPALDLNDPKLPLRYFRRLYDTRDLDDRSIQEFRERFQFEQTAAAYRLIDDDSVAVIVRYPQGAPFEDHSKRLSAIKARGWADQEDIRALQSVFVNLRRRAHQDAVAAGLCAEVAPGIWVWQGIYDDIRGIQWAHMRPEELVI